VKSGIVLKHEFLEFIPEDLEQGTLYVSMRFATASHLCCCGCGNKVVTPISPTDWQLTSNGKSVSLDPSIGNWSFPCQSHYWIRNNRVYWAAQWSQSQIEHGRLRDRNAKGNYLGDLEASSVTDQDIIDATTIKKSWWQTLKEWWQ
jgi:hypothetical protein